jgi:hypothetical protein
VQAIDKLHTSRDTIDITNKDTFIGIAMYFKALLLSVSNDKNIQIDRLYPIFIIPDEWKVETNDILEQIMVPLLTKADIRFDTEDYRDRVLFTGQLEAKMAILQLNKNSKQLPFIHNENRCILHTLYFDKYLMKLKATYFQVKEDYNLRLFNEKYYSLNIISMHEITVYDKELENSIKHFLKQFIFEKLLKMGHLTTTPIYAGSEISVDDDILRQILYSFTVCLHIFYK